MKKYILIFVFLLLIIFGIWYTCSNNTADTSDNLNTKLLEETKNYKIVAFENEKITEYHYCILDNASNTIYTDSSYKIPNLSYISDNIIQNYTGSGNVRQYQFFDTEEGLISPIYENPGLIDQKKIVYMTFEDNKIKLIVRDLFDKSKLYKEYERDFSPVAAAYNDLINVEPIDSNKLQITYLSGENFVKVTEIFDLR